MRNCKVVEPTAVLNDAVEEYIDTNFVTRLGKEKTKELFRNFYSYMNKLGYEVTSDVIEQLCIEKSNFSDVLDEYFYHDVPENRIEKILEKGFKQYYTFDYQEEKGAKIKSKIIRTYGSYKTDEKEFNKLLHEYKSGNKELKNTLIIMLLPLANEVALQYLKHRCNYEAIGIEYEDIVEDCVVSLMRAIDKFDEEREVKFSSYAWKSLIFVIDREVNKQKELISKPNNIDGLQKNIGMYMEKYKSENEVYPSVEEVCHHFGIKRSTAVPLCFNIQTVPIETEMSEVEKASCDNRYHDVEQVDEEVLNEVSKEKLVELLRHIFTEKKSKTLLDYMGFFQEPRSTIELAKEYGVSKSEVARRVKDALDVLRRTKKMAEFSYLAENPSKIEKTIKEEREKNDKALREKELLRKINRKNK